jgi:hypothetical protein
MCSPRIPYEVVRVALLELARGATIDRPCKFPKYRIALIAARKDSVKGTSQASASP